MRAAMALFTLLMVSFIVFSLMEMVPGDCAERYLAFKNTQGSQISVADIEVERIRLGLDKPFVQRWTTWLGKVFFKGEFGDSCILRLNIYFLLGVFFIIYLGI
jgi:peptide/nickel transport system permease protein